MIWVAEAAFFFLHWNYEYNVMNKSGKLSDYKFSIVQVVCIKLSNLCMTHCCLDKMMLKETSHPRVQSLSEPITGTLSMRQGYTPDGMQVHGRVPCIPCTHTHTEKRTCTVTLHRKKSLYSVCTMRNL